MTLTSTLYRQLLRASRRHDAQAHLKAWLTHPRDESIKQLDAHTLQTKLAQEVHRQRTVGAAPTTSSSSSSSSTPQHHRTRVRRAMHAVFDDIWRSRSSSNVQHVYDSFFGTVSNYYWPDVAAAGMKFAKLTKEEFRRPIDEKAASAGHERLTTDTTTAASSSSASASSRLSDAFSFLRIMNSNIASHPSVFTSHQIETDPAFEAYLEEERQRNAAVDREDLYRRWSSFGVMQPSSSIAQGRFLIAHPRMTAPWTSCVILLLSHDSKGSLGVIINSPDGEVIVQMHVRSLKPKATPAPSISLTLPASRGGPVPLIPIENRPSQMLGLDEDSLVASTIVLHQKKELAERDQSTQVISGNRPVWMLKSKQSMIEAILEERKANNSHNNKSQLLPSSSDSSNDSSHPSNTFSIYTGVCTWTPGQLEDEIAEGSWRLLEGDARHVFVRRKTDAIGKLEKEEANNDQPIPIPRELIWNHAMFQLGGEHRALARIEHDREE